MTEYQIGMSSKAKYGVGDEVYIYCHHKDEIVTARVMALRHERVRKYWWNPWGVEVERVVYIVSYRAKWLNLLGRICQEDILKEMREHEIKGKVYSK